MNNQLPILSEGKTGFGYLIENEGSTLSGKPQLVESKDDIVQALYVDCILQKGDTLNRNGRIYPFDILKREADKYMELIQVNSAVGEADHPDTSIISLHNISHRIVKIWWEGNILFGKLEILVSKPFLEQGLIQVVGDKIAFYLKKNVRLGISSRGVGSVEDKKGKHIVQADFEMICFDLVVSPSTPGAYLFPGGASSTMGESNVAREVVNESKIIKGIQNFLKS